MGWHGASPAVTTLGVPCSRLSVSQPRGGLGDRGGHRSPADLLHGPLEEPEAQPRWVQARRWAASRGHSCLVCRRLSGFGDFPSAKDGNSGAIRAAAGRYQSLLLQRAATVLRWSFSAEDEIYSDFLLEASAELWCVLMSDMLQRLARELPCHCSARCCCRFALAPCTYELYVQQRMGTGLVPRQESRPTALHHPFGRFSVPGRRVCVCFPSLSLVCWMVPCFSGSGGTGSHLLQSQGPCWVLGGWFRLCLRRG